MNGFGNEVGTVTNRVTSMFDVLARFEEGSKEYEELMYRITVSQHYQQLAIDKIKGIVAEPMPKSWYEPRECEDEFNKSICCNSKPYFMTYIYPQIESEKNAHDEIYNVNALRCFGETLETIKNKSKEELTKEEEDMLFYYEKYLPILNNNCTMNRICRYMERELNVVVSEKSKLVFDHSILQTSKPIDEVMKNQIEELYAEYKKRLTDLIQTSLVVRLEREDIKIYQKIFREEFKKKAIEICSREMVDSNTGANVKVFDEEEMCNIIVEVCYTSNGTKQFAWDICRKQMIKNLENNRG